MSPPEAVNTSHLVVTAQWTYGHWSDPIWQFPCIYRYMLLHLHLAICGWKALYKSIANTRDCWAEGWSEVPILPWCTMGPFTMHRAKLVLTSQPSRGLPVLFLHTALRVSSASLKARIWGLRLFLLPLQSQAASSLAVVLYLPITLPLYSHWAASRSRRLWWCLGKGRGAWRGREEASF